MPRPLIQPLKSLQSLLNVPYAALNAFIQKTLALDPQIDEILPSSASESIILNIKVLEPIPVLCYIQLSSEGLHLNEGHIVEHSTLSGNLSDFISLMRSPHPAQTFTTHPTLALDGNFKTILTLHQWIKRLDFDVAYWIESRLGNMPRTLFEQIQLKHKNKNQTLSTAKQLGDFLSHEKNYTPSKLELTHFFDEIQKLQKTYHRIAKKFERLELLEQLKKGS